MLVVVVVLLLLLHVLHTLLLLILAHCACRFNQSARANKDVLTMAMRGEGGALARRSTDRMTLEAKNKKGMNTTTRTIESNHKNNRD